MDIEKKRKTQGKSPPNVPTCRIRNQKLDTVDDTLGTSLYDTRSFEDVGKKLSVNLRD